jgi:hypothetical protein
MVMGMRMSKVVLVVSGELLRESFFPPLPLKWRGFQKGTCVRVSSIISISVISSSLGNASALGIFIFFNHPSTKALLFI